MKKDKPLKCPDCNRNMVYIGKWRDVRLYACKKCNGIIRRKEKKKCDDKE